MTHLNLNLPDKEDFRMWLMEVKNEMLQEIRREVSEKSKPQLRYITRKEIAIKYKISLVTLHALTTNGMPSIKVGKRRLYDPDEVEKYFENINKK